MKDKIKVLMVCHGKKSSLRKKLGKSMGYRLWKAEFTRNLHVKLRCFLGCDMAKIKYVYCRGSHAKLSRWQGTDLQRYVL